MPVAASRRTDQPGGTTTVVSYSSTSSGPGSGVSPMDERVRTGASTPSPPMWIRRLEPAAAAFAPSSWKERVAAASPSAASRSARISTGEPAWSLTP